MTHYLRGTTVLGADLYDEAAAGFATVEANVKKVHARISPWLWILSIWGAFGTFVTVWNKAEVLRARGWKVW